MDEGLKILSQIFELCIVPLLGILTTYIVKLLQSKKVEIDKTTDNEMVKKYTDMLLETVETCVIATNQTYVNSLKESSEFGPEAQKEAFQKTLNAVLQILGEEGKNYLEQTYGDLTIYIGNLIEAKVNKEKEG
jgi:hypothetical protein